MHIQVNRVIFINFLSHSNIAVVNTLQCVVLNITQYWTRLLSLNLQFFTRDDLQLSSYNFRNLWLLQSPVCLVMCHGFLLIIWGKSRHE